MTPPNVHAITPPVERPDERLTRLRQEIQALALQLVDGALRDVRGAAAALRHAGAYTELPEPLRDRLARLGVLIEAEVQSIEAVRVRSGS